jgi:hypothetical protein
MKILIAEDDSVSRRLRLRRAEELAAVHYLAKGRRRVCPGFVPVAHLHNKEQLGITGDDRTGAILGSETGWTQIVASHRNAPNGGSGIPPSPFPIHVVFRKI